MSPIQQVSLSQRAPDLAFELALRLAARGSSVVLFHFHEDGDGVPCHRIEAADLVPVRLGVFDIHLDDTEAALRAARAAGIDFVLTTFRALNEGLGGNRRIILNVKLTRADRELADLADELVALTDFAVQYGHSVIFIQVHDTEDAGPGV